jgi:hypothetical protein
MAEGKILIKKKRPGCNGGKAIKKEEQVVKESRP